MNAMKSNYSRLELLPNEILLIIFQYFNAHDLFQAFYNLNNRLNQIIQLFDELHLVYEIKTSNDNTNNIFRFYVYTLIVDSDIDINFNQFPNIHRLKIQNISKNKLSQLNSNILPHLEHLTLSDAGIFKTTHPYISFPTLNISTLGCSNSRNYLDILSSCPNLKFLDISIVAYYRGFSNIIIHTNLKRMIIRIVDIIPNLINGVMINYLSCVPNLERLSIHLAIFDSKVVESFVNYDWLRSIIINYLLLLKRFTFYLYMNNLNEFDENKKTNMIKQMHENFQIIHNNQYQCQLFIR